MRSSSLSIAGKTDPTLIFVYRQLTEAASVVDVDWLVVGATARDMIYHHAYATPIRRATRDIDIAINVDNWVAYEKLSQILVDSYGFTPNTISKHRFTLPESDMWIDIIPFGGVGNNSDNIDWPGESDLVFSTLGFKEALNTAIECHITTSAKLSIKIVHPAVLVMLKVISWSERRQRKNTDAQDIAYALRYYTELDNNTERVFNMPGITDVDIEMESIGARLLGWDLPALAPGRALAVVLDLLQEQIRLEDKSEFLADMMQGSTIPLAGVTTYKTMLSNLIAGIETRAER